MPVEIILPSPHEDERLRGGYGERYDQQICDKLGCKPEAVRNVRFIHNPNWRADNLMSLTAARECKRPLWQVVRVLWIAAQATLPLYWLSYRYAHSGR